MLTNKSIKNYTGFFIITYLAYASIYISRFNLSIAAPAFTAGGIMNEAQIGLLGSIFSIVYALGRLFNGTLNDKFTPWIMLCTGLVAVGLSNIYSGVFLSFSTMSVLWGINAYGQSMLWGSILQAMASVYEPNRVSKRTALLGSSVAVGNLLGILVNTWIIHITGNIRLAFIIPGGFNLLLCPLTFWALRKIPFVPATGKRKLLPFGLLKNKRIQQMLLPAFCHGVLKDNIGLWMAAFFVARFNLDLKNSSAFLLFIPTMGFLGRIGYNFIFRLSGKSEARVSAFSFIVCGITAVALCVPIGSPALAMVSLGIMFAAVSVINTYVLSVYPLSFAESGNIATVSGFMDFGVYLAGGIGAAIYGALIEKFGYTPMFLSWAALSVLALLFLPKKTK